MRVNVERMNNVNQGPFPSSAHNSSLAADINRFAVSADALACEILNKDAPQQPSYPNYFSNPPTIIHNYHYTDSLWFWSPPVRTVHVIHTRESDTCNFNNSHSTKKESDGTATLALILIAVGGIAAFATYAAGSANARYEDAKQELEETQAFQNKLAVCENAAPKNEKVLIAEAKHLSYLQERVCKRIQDSAAADYYNRIAAVNGAGVAALGAAAGYFGVLGTLAAAGTASVCLGTVPGAIILTAAIGNMLFKSGFDTSDKQNNRDALSMRTSILAIKNS
jgi:hypothetical protein